MELDEKQLTALVVNTVREAISAKNAEDELEALKAKNAELEDELKGLKGKKEEGATENGEAFEGKETADEEKKEAATLENAKPAQTVVAAFSTAFNTDFGSKTPSFSLLAALAGIVETDPAKRIAAVNAKFDEIQKNAPKDKSTAANTSVEVF